MRKTTIAIPFTQKEIRRPLPALYQMDSKQQKIKFFAQIVINVKNGVLFLIL